jgi:hypothetical protein
MTGSLFMFGSIFFYASDNFAAHGKFNTWYMDRVGASTNSYLKMIFYYLAQYMIAKGVYFAARHFNEEKGEAGLTSKESSHNLP